MKKDWTVYIILTILIGSFAWTCYGNTEKKGMLEKHGIKSEVSEDDAKAMKIAELEATLAVLKEELSVMRKELIDVLKESEKRDIDYARLKVSIAASLAEGNKKSYDKNGAEIMEALTEISEKGDALVANSAKFCDFIDALLEKKEISDVEKVRARFRMSKLRSTAEVFHARIQKPSKGKLFSSCRILTVNDKLQVVVLNVGSVYGMRNGVLLNGGDKGEIELKIVSVRPFISGAVVIKGDIEDLAPGMEVRNGK
jgi:regulator of replication initiation timing